jgi:hypothetical protein
MGLLGTIEFMVAAVLAARIALLGVDSLARGETTTGVIFLGLAVALLVIERVAPSITDIPGLLVGGTKNALPGGREPPQGGDGSSDDKE